MSKENFLRCILSLLQGKIEEGAPTETGPKEGDLENTGPGEGWWYVIFLETSKRLFYHTQPADVT